MDNRIEREKWIDYAKTFACILVALGHLLGGLQKSGVQWNDTLYDYIGEFIYLFHMPLFMCISGYLYAKTTNIESFKEYRKFIRKKLINLGIPYIVFYVLHVCVNMLFSSSVNNKMGITEIKNIFIKPIAPFWFLYALFFIFVTIPIIEKSFNNNEKLVGFTTLCLHIMGIYVKTNVYVIDVLMQYLLYFYLGKVLLNIQLKTKKIVAKIITFIIFATIYYVLTLQSNVSSHILDVYSLIMAISGTLISLQIFKRFEPKIEKSKKYNKLSRYTFQIYLLHTMFSAGTRIILLKLSITNFAIHFILGFIMGIMAPIIFAKVLELTRYGSFVFFPLKTLKNIRSEG